MSVPRPRYRRKSTLLIVLAAASLALGAVDGPAAQAAGKTGADYPPDVPG